MRSFPALRGLAALATGPLLVACAGEYPQSSIDPRTDFAVIIQDLYSLITWISLVILVVVWALLAYVLVRYRERPDAPHPKQIHGHLGLEIAWTVVPALIVVAIAVPTVQAVFATQRGNPGEAMVVEVVGHRFWWEFRYPEEGVVTANELHLPVGRPVSLRLHSDDVIHSFWVPMLGGKRDVNPLRRVPEGQDPRYNWLHFTIQEPGVYMGQCAEFCGEAHALMGVRVVAQSEEEFADWLEDWSGPAAAAEAAVEADTAEADAPAAQGPEAGPAGQEVPAVLDEGEVAELSGQELELPEGVDPELVEQGREVFLQSTCIACHAIQGTSAQGRVGPDLTLLGRRGTLGAGWMDNSVENLVRWINAPQTIKPGAQMPGVDAPGGNWPATGLSEEQVLAVAHYLYSLR